MFYQTEAKPQGWRAVAVFDDRPEQLLYMNRSSTDLLFRPFPFGRKSLRNRIVMGPMTRQRSPQGVPGDDVAAYYQRRAAAGVGLIISEGTYIDHPAAAAQTGVPHFFGEAALAGWKQVLAGVHAAGAAMIPQLWHTGAIRRLGWPPNSSVPGIGPCARVKNGVEVVRAATIDDLGEIARSYARAARNAERFGFDGLALHGGHGYLLDQFLWARDNARDDAYGGSLRNRTRFPAEVVAAIRTVVSADFPVVFRFSQWKMDDYEARIAETPKELGVIVGALAEAGVDVFDVSTRRFWEPAFAGSDLSLAAWTRRLSGKPVIAVGSVGLDQPHQSKVFRLPDNVDAKVVDLSRVTQRMAAGDFDLVAVARAILVDPLWVEKIRAGDYGRIIPYTFGASQRYL